MIFARERVNQLCYPGSLQTRRENSRASAKRASPLPSWPGFTLGHPRAPSGQKATEDRGVSTPLPAPLPSHPSALAIHIVSWIDTHTHTHTHTGLTLPQIIVRHGRSCYSHLPLTPSLHTHKTSQSIESSFKVPKFQYPFNSIIM
jgi:hypothetical protein